MHRWTDFALDRFPGLSQAEADLGTDLGGINAGLPPARTDLRVNGPAPSFGC